MSIIFYHKNLFSLQEASGTEQSSMGIYSPTAKLLSSVRSIMSIQTSNCVKQSKYGMDKLDGTSDNIYEIDTSFSTVKNKRPVETNEEEVRPTIITYCSVFYMLVYMLS